MKKLLLLISFTVKQLCAYSIVFVHLGPQLPVYIPDACAQARLFNANCPIYVIGNKSALLQRTGWMRRYRIQTVDADELTKTEEHLQFLGQTKRTGLWRYSCERFLCLYDFMKQFKVADVVHLENDVMLYEDIANLMPVFKKYYPGIAAVFDNDDRCIPGFVYIADHQALALLAVNFIKYASNIDLMKSDMAIIAEFKNNNPKEVIDQLPLIVSSYCGLQGLKSGRGHQTRTPERYTQYVDEFKSIFDAAALGQYLGGIDPFHPGGGTPGFVNESCLFDPSKCEYVWELDEQNRRVPYLIFNNEKYRINNLHIHSKNLSAFKSECVRDSTILD